MYFVTTKRAGYVLFCVTPSERAAVGLTEGQMVHLLVHNPAANDWTILRQWDAAEFSHTDFMAAWHHLNEPAEPTDLLAVLPDKLRQ
jgi:hypothetical protein